MNDHENNEELGPKQDIANATINAREFINNARLSSDADVIRESLADCRICLNEATIALIALKRQRPEGNRRRPKGEKARVELIESHLDACRKKLTDAQTQTDAAQRATMAEIAAYCTDIEVFCVSPLGMES